MILRCAIAVGLAASALFTMPAAHAARSYDNCTGFIDSVPATISTQGVWCLRKDVSTGLTNTTAINVIASNVTIDCNDFKLGGLAAGTATLSFGIYSGSRNNITVRNCNIRGFHTGVQFDEGRGHLVEDNRLEGNTQSGIVISGDNSTVRRNLISTTGGSTHPEQSSKALGIVTISTVDVLDNTIDGVVPRGDASGNGSATGIFSATNAGGTISGNRIRGVTAQGLGIARAIQIFEMQGVFITGNHLRGDGSGYGVYCDGPAGLVRDNQSMFFDTDVFNCTDAGGNAAF